MYNKTVNSIKQFTSIAASICLLPFLVHSAAAQLFTMQEEPLLTAKAYLSISTFHRGSTGYIAVTADIREGWHINSNEPLERYLIPTRLVVSVPEDIEVAKILYPDPVLKRLGTGPEEMSLFDGSVNFGAILKIGDKAQPGLYKITATLHFQGCDNLSCIEPSSVTVETNLKVGTLGETTDLLHPEIFSRPPFTEGEGRSSAVSYGEGEEKSLGGIIAERGLLLAFLFIFIGGLALDLTPCIYPIIPITISYFGGQSGGKTSRVFLLALFYVLGMSITYSALGTIAATTGSLFGSALQNTWVIVFIAAVLIGLATSMFGLWEIRMPMFLTRTTGTAKKGYLGALFMGLTVGIMAAPCIGPFVLGLLTYVGETGNPVLGFLMFFTLAWGMGLPLLVLGTISGSISRLPRSGDWLVWVKKIFGFVLIAMAFYFARYVIGGKLTSAGYGLTALAAGIYLGWLEKSAGRGKAFAAVRFLVGIAGIAIAAIVISLPGGPLRSAREKPSIAWTALSEEKLAEAAREEKPVIIDFEADWCIPCHELDRRSFSDPDVIELSKKFVPLKVDLTRPGDYENRIKKDFEIQGVPTIIFIDRSGREIPELRINGFVGPEEIRIRMDKASKNV